MEKKDNSLLWLRVRGCLKCANVASIDLAKREFFFLGIVGSTQMWLLTCYSTTWGVAFLIIFILSSHNHMFDKNVYLAFHRVGSGLLVQYIPRPDITPSSGQAQSSLT